MINRHWSLKWSGNSPQEHQSSGQAWELASCWPSLFDSFIWIAQNVLAWRTEVQLCLSGRVGGVEDEDAESCGNKAFVGGQLPAPISAWLAGPRLWSQGPFPWEIFPFLSSLRTAPLTHSAHPSLVQFQGKWAVCPVTISGLYKQAEGQSVSLSGLGALFCLHKWRLITHFLDCRLESMR